MKRANLEKEGGSGGSKERFQYDVPVASMIMQALMQLPDEQGTARQIENKIAANPLQGPTLDWSHDTSQKDLYRWQIAVSWHLAHNPKVAFAFIQFALNMTAILYAQCC